jgi:hypothetical protein
MATRQASIGPQGVPCKTAQSARVLTLARSPDWRLEVAGPKPLNLTLAELESMGSTTQHFSAHLCRGMERRGRVGRHSRDWPRPSCGWRCVLTRRRLLAAAPRPWRVRSGHRRAADFQLGWTARSRSAATTRTVTKSSLVWRRLPASEASVATVQRNRLFSGPHTRRSDAPRGSRHERKDFPPSSRRQECRKRNLTGTSNTSSWTLSTRSSPSRSRIAVMGLLL